MQENNKTSLKKHIKSQKMLKNIKRSTLETLKLMQKKNTVLKMKKQTITKNALESQKYFTKNDNCTVFLFLSFLHHI